MNVNELNSALNEAIKNQEVTFVFRKKNGELRLATGTTNMDLIPSEDHPTRPGNGGCKRFYDVKESAWRAFCQKNLLWVEEFGFADNLSSEDETEIMQLLA